MDAMANKLTPFADRIGKNKYIGAITNGLASSLSIIMIGAIASLLQGIPVAGYTGFLKSSGLYDILSIVNAFTLNMIAVYAVFFVAYRLAVTLEVDGVMAGSLALLAFFILTPLGSTKDKTGVISYIPFDWLGSQGLIMALIVGILVAKFYAFIVHRNIVIKMPEGVPAAVSNSFVALIPGFMIAIIALVVSAAFKMTPFGSFPKCIYAFLQQPLQGLGSSFWTSLFISFLIDFLWLFGIHGAMVVMPISMAMMMPLDLQNIAAYSAGKQVPNILCSAFGMVYGALGGAGCTLGLVIIMTFFAKSKRYKTLGKLALLPGLCTINEPVIFGMPVIFNPILALPFLIVPLVNTSIAYFLTWIGMVPRCNGVSISMGVPPIVSGLLEGSWIISVLQVLLIILDALIYLPFFKILDKKSIAEEATDSQKETVSE
jgi:PTS system cellobiose-specific IIC component